MGDLFFAEANENDAILTCVGEKDVSECRSDDGAEAEVAESPCGVLAAGAAGEGLAGYEDLSTLVARIIQDKRWVRIARTGTTPVEEEEIAVAGALDALKELLGNDLVGIDVGSVEGCGQCGQCAKGYHQAFPPCNAGSRTAQLRMSTKWPAIAAAAAISGDTR